MKNIDALLGWLGARLKEPSSYAGLGIILMAMHLSIPPDIVKSITYIGMGVGGILAVVFPENGAVPAAPSVPDRATAVAN
jgi:hypothetical protein